jgi:2-C-methyl-D-erythritol 4-phosphate cytidylyltransferase
MSAGLKRSVIIAAGGSGSRMGSETPKQFLSIAGKPIIFHSIEKFVSVYPDIEVVCVLPVQYTDLFDETRFKIVVGGANRFESIKRGLAVADGDIIAIHDAVRPLVSTDVIQKSFETAEVAGAAIPVLLPKDSLRVLTSDESEAVNREHYRIF